MKRVLRPLKFLPKVGRISSPSQKSREFKLFTPSLDRVILFDLDGTLINSESLHAQALAELLTTHGVHYSATELEEQFTGLPDYLVFSELDQRHSFSFSAEEMVEQKNAILLKIIERIDPKEFDKLLTPGIRNFLSKLALYRYRLGVVSASERPIVHACLKKGDLSYFFEHIITRNDCFQSKPNPAPYLLAMRKFKTDSSQVVIFEDSPAGLQAANLTGAKTIQITQHSPAGQSTQGPPSLLKIDNFSRLLTNIQ